MNLPNQLKAELAQLAADNQRLREALEYMASKICGNSELSGEAGHFYRGYNAVIKDHRAKAQEILQTPPTPGYGAAMLRVVEDVNSDIANYGDSCVPRKTLEAVQALNELEAKHE